MITPELNLKLEKLLTMVNDADEILKRQAREIYAMPQADRKPYLDEHYTLKDYVDESWLILSAMASELDKRATTQQYKQVTQQLTAARTYIRSLGGNPSNLTFS
jgi:hypothetical protein